MQLRGQRNLDSVAHFAKKKINLPDSLSQTIPGYRKSTVAFVL